MNTTFVNAFTDELTKLAKDRSVFDFPEKAQKGIFATNRKDYDENARRGNQYFSEIGKEGRGLYALGTGATLAAIVKKMRQPNPLLMGAAGGLGHYLAISGMAKKHTELKKRKGKK